MTEAVELPRPRAPLNETRASSARALLLVVLGEFVFPSPKPVWSSTLLAALADLDVEPNAARKAIHRTAETGLIAAERQGRRVRWTITPKGFDVLSAGEERVLRWDSRDTDWDGRWLFVSVTVPESRRRLRHHLQSRLSWAGLGSPLPGEWLTTHWERADEVARIVHGLGLDEQAHMLIGAPGPIFDERRIVRTAWDLEGLADDYREFIDTYRELSPRTELDCLRARIELTQDWRRFPYLDPDLPAEYLPPDWPGQQAARTFRDRHNALLVRSVRHWNKLLRVE